jgi:predicted alpha/beta superfamily hydrolase
MSFHRRPRPGPLVRRRVRPGSMYVLRDVHSPQLHNHRDVYVYLPPSYGMGDHRFPVLYMHDGQNLFDPALSFAGAWRVDHGMAAAARIGFEAIVVGVANLGGSRIDEYGPFFDETVGGGGVADLYLDFLLQTLKPSIDEQFRTLPEPAQTGIAGSSMGGLVSLYAFFRDPQAWGFTAAMSPALWFGNRAIFRWVEQAASPPGRIYLDVGTNEGVRTLANARRMKELLMAKGYVLGRDLRWVEDVGGRHEEVAWGRRFRKTIPFLLSEPAGVPAGGS